jgi:hypothetical protein
MSDIELDAGSQAQARATVDALEKLVAEGLAALTTEERMLIELEGLRLRVLARMPVRLWAGKMPARAQLRLVEDEGPGAA